MKVSEHIMRLNKIIQELTEELHYINNDGHLSGYNDSWKLLNDIELDIHELRTFMLENT